LLANLLLPALPAFQLNKISADETSITLVLTMTSATAACPLCHQASSRVHSGYNRTLADLPWARIPICLRLHVRRFFCDQIDCPRRIFTERLGPAIAPYARRTHRLELLLEAIASALGGEAGARLARRSGMSSSPTTLLRHLHCAPEPTVPTPRVLGVDDWAKRKGQSYGTLLVDLEAHQPIELLPDREADTFATWLQQHPGVEIISRDRAGAYADGAQRGAPAALQVADRFHLLQNLREAVQRLMDRQQKILRQVAASVERADIASPQPVPSSESGIPTEPPGIVPVLTRAEVRRQQSRARRQARYADVQQLQQEGWSRRAIARKLKMSRHTVGRFLDTDSFPERACPPRHSSLLDRYVPYLTQQMQAGQTNGMQLWRDLCAQGYRGSRPLVSRWVAQHRHLHPAPPRSAEKGRTRGRPPHLRSGLPAETIRPLSARRAAWLVVRPPEDLDEDQQQTLARLRALSPEVQAIYPLAQEFGQMVRTRAGLSFEPWLQRVREKKVREFLSFASSLERDKAAVLAGLSLPYSNGQVEGQINRLKLIKRSMYGRGNFDLLRKRVLLADTS
jgi:transposase